MPASRPCSRERPAAPADYELCEGRSESSPAAQVTAPRCRIRYAWGDLRHDKCPSLTSAHRAAEGDNVGDLGFRYVSEVRNQVVAAFGNVGLAPVTLEGIRTG
jgi:hypothetical protein